MFIFLVTASIFLIPTVIIIISVKPGKIPPEAADTAEKFRGLNCAHRGLYTEDQSVPENSIASFVAARDAGYGVELDVHLTKDEKIVVFHDYNLKRTCGVDKELIDMTYEEVTEYRLFGTEQKIPLLTEVLEILGDTPTIVEFKPSGSYNTLLCERTYEILREHGKVWCMESFDPRICSWFRKNAPGVLRGLLNCPPRDYKYEGMSWWASFILGNMLLNSIARPHFVAYKAKKKCTRISKLCFIMKPMKAVWTIDPEHDIPKLEEENDILIFEHYTPATKFKE